MPSIHIETSQVAGIPILTLSPEHHSPRPLVFFNHGFTGCKEEGLDFGYRLAEAGLFCVFLDASLHGERRAAPLDNLGAPDRSYIYPPGCGFDTYFVMLECALQTARDIETLIDHFTTDTRVDAARVGVTGFSMGGFATFLSAASSLRVTTAVPMGAYPDFSRRWQDLVTEASVYEEWTADIEALAAENERRAAWLANIDPAKKLLESYRKPLFIVQGDLDTDSPKAYSIPFYSAMRQHYRDHPERLRLKIHDHTAHQLNNSMIADAVAWFHRFLG